jgi:glucosamine-6-phosphate deaminase
VRYVTLSPETRRTNEKYFADPSEMPPGAITIGIHETLTLPTDILQNAKGEEKAWGINRTYTGPISPDAPSSYLRLRDRVTVALDAAAASQLPESFIAVRVAAKSINGKQIFRNPAAIARSRG